MNFKYENTTIVEFLQNNSFYIPIFQREYSWSYNLEVDVLMNDLETRWEDKKDHYMGIVHVSKYKYENNVLNVVDG